MKQNGTTGLVAIVSTPIQDTPFIQGNRSTKSKNMVQYIYMKKILHLKLSGLACTTVSELERGD